MFGGQLELRPGACKIEWGMRDLEIVDIKLGKALGEYDFDEQNL